MITGRNQRIKRVILAFILAVSAGAAHAEWNVQALMTALAERPAGQARYSETKTSTLLKEPLKLTGILRYRKPAFLEKRVLTPFEETMTVDGERLTWEKPAAKQKRVVALRDYPAVWAFIESMRSTLNGDANMLGSFYKLRLDGNERQWSLLLLPSDPDMAQFIQVIRIGGSKAAILTVEVEETGGDRSLMTLREEVP